MKSKLTTPRLLALALPLACAGLSALDRPRAGFLQDVLESNAADHKNCKPSGLIEDACCGFEDVEQVNNDLFSSLHAIVEKPYFRYHKVDLFKECPFWQEDGSCMNRACSVETTEEDEIPEAWRSQTLGKIQEDSFPAQEQIPKGCDVHESDFCVLEDELDSEGLYVDLLGNPERFTGYAGSSASRVWKAIYEENCFTTIPFIDPSRSKDQGGSGFASLSPSSGGSFGMPAFPSSLDPTKGLLGSLAGPRDGGDEICLEKRVFYRLISGLHASISIHICDDYLDQRTGTWAPNLECFITRIGEHPERLQNVYFTYVVLLRALAKSGPQLIRTIGATAGDQPTVDKFSHLLELAQGCPTTFDEGSMFSGPEAEVLKTEFKEHFRNVSRIMDCVGCDKCRLWGKLQVTGLGTALKLLFSYDDSLSPAPAGALSDVGSATGFALSRSEVVAFINTLHRLSESLGAVEKFRMMWQVRERAGLEMEGPVGGRRDPQEVVQPPPVAPPTSSLAPAGMPQKEPTQPVAFEDDDAIEQPLTESDERRSPPRSAPSSRTGKQPWAPHLLLERLIESCQKGWRSCVGLWEQVVLGGWKAQDGASHGGKAEL